MNLPTFADPRVLSNGADADPLGVRRLCRLRTATESRMAALVIVLLVTVGLAFRARIHSMSWNVADADRAQRIALVDSCARTFVLVLLSLIGLLALGVTYGNVLGAVSTSP
jgi:hypothetical protein